MNQSVTTSAASRLKSGVVLLILFPLLSYALLLIVETPPFFPSAWAVVEIFAFYGFLIGFFLPVELKLTGSCVKQIMIRYGVLNLLFGIIGIAGFVILSIILAHDS
jgi:hypothetical protein